MNLFKEFSKLDPSELRKLRLFFVYNLIYSILTIGVLAIVGFLASFLTSAKVEHITIRQLVVDVDLIVLAAVVIIIIYSFISLKYYKYNAKIPLEIGTSISVKLFSNYLHKKYVFFLTRNVSELTNNVFIEARRLSDMVVIPLIQLISVSIFILVALVALIFSFGWVVIFGILMFGFFFLLFYQFSKRIYNFSNDNLTQLSKKRYQLVLGAFNSIKELKIRRLIKLKEAEFQRTSQTYADIQAGTAYRAVVPRSVIESLLYLVLISIFYLISKDWLILKDPKKIVFLFLLGIRFLPIFQMFYTNLSKILSNFNIWEVLQKDLVQVGVDSLDVGYTENISFKSLDIVIMNLVVDSRTLVKNAKLTLNRGECYAILGPSGSGKTTFFDFLVGLQDSTGVLSVFLNDRKLSIKDFGSLHKSIGYLPQNPSVVEGSLLQNITFHTVEEMNQSFIEKLSYALEYSCFKEVVDRLPMGLDTQLDISTNILSGGELQRMGLARLLFENKEILLIDEGTSALDQNIEARIIENLRNSSKTVLLITHRVSAVYKFEHFFIFENGYINVYNDFREVLKRLPNS